MPELVLKRPSEPSRSREKVGQAKHRVGSEPQEKEGNLPGEPRGLESWRGPCLWALSDPALAPEPQLFLCQPAELRNCFPNQQAGVSTSYSAKKEFHCQNARRMVDQSDLDSLLQALSEPLCMVSLKRA